MRRCKLLLAALGATLLLGLSTSAAGARNLSWSSQTFRSTYPAFAVFASPIEGRCPLTLEGSLHARTFSKVVETLIGFITGATLGSCTGNALRLLTATLPWHMRYRAFAGVLPRVTSMLINIIGFAIGITETFSPFCLAVSTTAQPMVMRVDRETTTGALTGSPMAGEIVIGGECVEAGRRLRSEETGSAPVVPGTATPITLTLI